LKLGSDSSIRLKKKKEEETRKGKKEEGKRRAILFSEREIVVMGNFCWDRYSRGSNGIP